MTRAVGKSVFKSLREAFVGAQLAVCPSGSAPPGSAQASFHKAGIRAEPTEKV